MVAGASDEPTAQLTDVVGSSELSATGAFSSAVAPDISKKIFDFFSLPRELRDKIYEQPVLFEHQRLPSGKHDFFMKARKLRTTLLLINRQFKREYSERCEKQQVLCFRDHRSAVPVDANIAARDVAERWKIDYCYHEDGISFDEIWQEFDSIQKFLMNFVPRYPKLRSVSIKLYVSDSLFSGGDLTVLKEQLSRVPAFDRVDVFEVYRIVRLYHYKKASEPRKLLARWGRSVNTPLELLDSLASEDGTESEWEAFEDEDFGDASGDERAHLSHDESDSDTEGSGSDDDEQNDDEDGHDSDSSDDSSKNEPKDKGSASDKDDKKDSDARDANQDADESDGNDKPRSIDQAVDAALEPTSGYFDFFGLPRELRNMIYNQAGMLGEKNLYPTGADSHYVMEDFFAMKPQDSLLLVNRQFCAEYRESCEGRVELYFSGDRLAMFDRCPELKKVAQKANTLTLRIGRCFLSMDPDRPRGFSSLIEWVRRNSPLMPKLRSIDVRIYTVTPFVKDFVGTRTFFKDDVRLQNSLLDLLNLNIHIQCQIVLMESAAKWESPDVRKELLIKWKSSDIAPPTISETSNRLAEPCCDRTYGDADSHRAFHGPYN